MPYDDKKIVTVKSSISEDFYNYDDALKFAKKVVSSDQFNSALICMSISEVRDNLPITAIQSYAPMSSEEIAAARKDAKEVKALETALNRLQDYKDAKAKVLRYEADQRFNEKLAKEMAKENIE